MNENFTGMLNWNFGMSYGDAEISRNSTGKIASVSIHSLEGKEEDEELNGNIWNHEGINLGEKFGAEMLDFDTPWDWIQDRINREDWTGINVGDYIQGNTKQANIIYKAFILGINTYKYLRDPNETHIDFAFRLYNASGSTFNLSRAMNDGNCNNSLTNGTAAYKATDMYHYLNSLSGTIRTGASSTQEVDYTETGFLTRYVPDEILNRIVEKMISCPVRYASATSLSSNDTGRAETSLGKIWLLDICEIRPFSLVTNVVASMSASYVVQYPIFANNTAFGMIAGSNIFWTRTPPAGTNSTFITNHREYTKTLNPTSGSSFLPCFRLAKGV